MPYFSPLQQQTWMFVIVMPFASTFLCEEHLSDLPSQTSTFNPSTGTSFEQLCSVTLTLCPSTFLKMVNNRKWNKKYYILLFKWHWYTVSLTVHDSGVIVEVPACAHATLLLGAEKTIFTGAENYENVKYVFIYRIVINIYQNKCLKESKWKTFESWFCF